MVFVDESVFPQTLAVVTTRAIPQGIRIRTGKYGETELTPDTFACIVQYPNAGGNIEDYRAFVEKAHAAGCKVAVAADILSLALLTPPGEWGADIVFGTTQRLGTPMFYGGPSAAYFATRDEYKRNMPGRIIGWSKDKYGKLCYRMALQTREQHIKREKATSNICTAQALLATMAGFYAVYHGPEGIRTIAGRIHSIAAFLEKEINKLGYRQMNAQYFDTLRFALPDNVSAQQVRTVALSKEVNLRYFKPFIGSLLGGACGALYASIVGLGATGTGVTGIFGILLHLHMPLQYLIMMAISFGVSFAVTWVIWTPEAEEAKA